jgi:hypothetical protein
VTKIKKVVITAYGDESKLAIVESDLPDPASGEVQLAVEYTNTPSFPAPMSICAVGPIHSRRGRL